MDENNVTVTETAEQVPQLEKKHLPPLVKNIIKYALTFLLIGTLFTAVTAIFPIFPFQLQTAEQINPIKFGVPFGFIEMTPDKATLNSFADSKGISWSFFLPRYDLYSVNIVWWKAVANVAIASAFFALIFFFFTNFKKIAKKLLLFTVIGFIIAAFSSFMPKKFNVDEIDPMHFGGVIPFVEQTPDLGTVYTASDLEEWLPQTYLVPKYTPTYATQIVVWKLALSSLLNGLIIAAIWYCLRWLKYYLFGGKDVAKQKFKEEKLKLLPQVPKSSTLRLKNLDEPLDKSKK